MDKPLLTFAVSHIVAIITPMLQASKCGESGCLAQPSQVLQNRGSWMFMYTKS